MTKKIALIGVIALMLVVGTNFTAKAESDDSMEALKEKAMKAEKKAMELEEKLKFAGKIKNVDDLDDAPNIDAPHKGGPALVIGPKGQASVWMKLTAANQIAYTAVAGNPTPPYAVWNLEGDVWGMKVKVSVMDSSVTKLVPEQATFKVGDQVGVHGTITMKEGIITAKRVKNHSLADDKTLEISAKIQELLKRMKELCAALTTKPAICGTL
ncbi:MAG: hypothetical protein AAB518_02825 [Patescibacteria group bacterium]